MQIQVINDRGQHDSTAEIRRLITAAAQCGSEIRTVFAEAYASAGLIDALQIRFNRGDREILVMHCSRLQVQAVLEWQACDEKAEFEGLVIHLVRTQEEQNHA
jgi:hypothetical protein